MLHRSPLAARYGHFLSVTALLLASGLPLLVQAREFSDVTGKFRIEAEYAGTKDGLILLRKTNGVTVGVPPQRLSKADLDYIARLDAGAPGGAPARAGEVDLAAIESAEAYVRTVLDALYSGDMKTAWDALPATYQSDVNEVVQLFGQRMDGKLWNRGFGVAAKVVAVLQDKKPFILGHPAVGMLDQEGDVAKNYDAIVAFIATIVNSEISDIEKVKTLDVGEFMATTGQKLTNQMKLLAQASGAETPLAPPEVTVKTIRQDGDTAVLEIDAPQLGQAAGAFQFGGGPGGPGDDFGAPAAAPEGPQQVTFVRVEGRWIPQEMAVGWAEGVAEMKESLNQLTPQKFAEINQAAPFLFAMIEGVVAKFQAAGTQAEFDAVIAELGETFGGMLGGAGGGAAFGNANDADPFGN